MNICPNCGAVLSRHAFMLICDYCGYSTCQNIEILHTFSKSTDSIKTRYERLLINEIDINKSKFVDLKFTDKTIIVHCKKSFFGNDFHYNKIDLLSIEYMYFNDGCNEKLMIVIKSDKEMYVQPQFIIRINRKSCIVPNYCNKSNGKYFFSLLTEELYMICKADLIGIATNLTDEESVNYDELKFYSCRFYNLIFDKRKFLYSLNMNLITD